MPELPEVQTIACQLNNALSGKTIKKVEVFLPKIVKVSPPVFQKMVRGAAIKKIFRRAKILVWELKGDWSLLFHLKMTGQLIFLPSRDKRPRGKHSHVVFSFIDGSRLFFNELRQFGYLKIIKTADLPNFFQREKLGPEPLSRDFTLADWQAILARRPRAKIKQFLLDQKNVAGIGNIYADEILFAAGVNPLRLTKSLKSKETHRLFLAIKRILALAVKLKGTSASDYLDAFGQPGDFEKKLCVYGREGQKCVKCKSVIKRIKINGRSAHFCPACQHLMP